MSVSLTDAQKLQYLELSGVEVIRLQDHHRAALRRLAAGKQSALASSSATIMFVTTAGAELPRWTTF